MVTPLIDRCRPLAVDPSAARRAARTIALSPERRAQQETDDYLGSLVAYSLHGSDRLPVALEGRCLREDLKRGMRMGSTERRARAWAARRRQSPSTPPGVAAQIPAWRAQDRLARRRQRAQALGRESTICAVVAALAPRGRSRAEPAATVVGVFVGLWALQEAQARCMPHALGLAQLLQQASSVLLAGLAARALVYTLSPSEPWASCGSTR